MVSNPKHVQLMRDVQSVMIENEDLIHKKALLEKTIDELLSWAESVEGAQVSQNITKHGEIFETARSVLRYTTKERA